MHTSTHVRRAVTALLAAGAVVAGLAVVLATPAGAANPLGTVAINPASGTETTGLEGTLSAACPADSTGQNGFISGPGLTGEAVIDSNRSPATTFSFTNTLLDVFQTAGIAAPSGTYTVRIACIGPDFFTETGEFTRQLSITPRTGSASTVNYVVQSTIPAGPVTLTGTARVGKVLTCATAPVSGATQAYAWLRNGVATGSTTTTVSVPASWYNTTVSCRVTTTKDSESVQRTSAALKVGAGDALHYTVRPSLRGKARVGKILTCSAGAWQPAAASYKYLWFRGTKALSTKTKATYKVVRKDKGKLISCRVTAIRTGYGSGVAKTPAKKVK
jgi:hypothetical protein